MKTMQCVGCLEFFEVSDEAAVIFDPDEFLCLFCCEAEGFDDDFFYDQEQSNESTHDLKNRK